VGISPKKTCEGFLSENAVWQQVRLLLPPMIVNPQLSLNVKDKRGGPPYIYYLTSGANRFFPSS